MTPAGFSAGPGPLKRWLNPCGQVMDYLSRCYTFKLRPYRDSAEVVDARWFFCRPGAKVYPGTHLFGSQVWRPESPNEPEGPGELFGPKRFDRGRNPGYLGQCSLGDPAWYGGGVPVASVTGTPPVLPPCCFVQPPDRAGARAGFRGWSVVRLRNRWGARAGFRGDVATGQAGAWGLAAGGRDGVTEAGFWGLLSGLDGPRRYVGSWGLAGGADDTMTLLQCEVVQSVPQLYPADSFAALVWNLALYDPSGMWSALAPTRITVPRDGLYLVNHEMLWQSVAVGARLAAWVAANGGRLSDLWDSPCASALADLRSGSSVERLSAGDYVEVYALMGDAVGRYTSAGTARAVSVRVTWLGPI